MELKLVVLAGAKQDLEIPLKKDNFLIGRSKECALRAGSEAISRRHCALTRAGDQWTVRDLGSRNGTYVNDERITAEVPLKVGDEVRVGPLKFRVAPQITAQPAPTAAPDAVPAGKPRKQPPVKSVADVVQRTISKADDSTTEDDVSRWLLGLPDTKNEDTLKETRTIRLEETTVHRAHGKDAASTVDELNALSSDETEQLAEEGSDIKPDGENADEKSGSWSFFRRGKAPAPKKTPGKLPPRTDALSKDSREAAADILREMTRRR